MGPMLMLALIGLTTSAAADFGPRLTDEEFFSMLIPGYPGLEKVEKAVKAGDYAAARHEFAEYLRRRTKPVWYFDPHSRPKHEKRPENVDTSEADRILNRELPSVGVYHKFEGEIDWNLNPINYKEWPWQLNRHPFWVTLGRAYWATGEEKYAQEFVYQMTDWVRKNPVPTETSGNETYTWRTIEQGIRCSTSWPEAFFLFLTSPSFNDDAVVTMVKSFVEHARQLMKWHTGGNWLTMESNGLMHVGVLFPEFKEASDWRRTATERLYAELDRQVYPDGAQIELTTGYHQVSLLNFLRAYEIARLNDIDMPYDYIAKLEKMYDYNLKVCMPDRTLPDINDGGRINVKASLTRAFELFPKRKDFQWISTDGREGAPPSFTSVALPFAGQLVMRSGWDKDALYLMMDAGPYGYGHQHEDALSIVLHAHGKYHVVDPGNYAYDNSQWRKYVLSTRAHNTVMVDGKEQHRANKSRDGYVVSKPLPNKWASNPRFDYAAGTYDKRYGPENETAVTHTRHIFFVKPEYWIITDFLSPADDTEHLYESLFHLDADGAAVDPSSQGVTTTNKDAANLSIIPVPSDGLSTIIVSGQEQPVVQGWMPAGQTTVYKCRPIPTAVFSKRAVGTTYMAYVLYPTPKGTSCPIKQIRAASVTSEDGSFATGLEIQFADGRRDYFLQASKRGRFRFSDFEADALAVYVRTNGRAVEAAALVDGGTLSRNGTPLPADRLTAQDLSRTKLTHKF
ncbi:MAG: alginate lyase family protein [Armatimonadota bacterium]|nr:alginate lyase family protein [Armatimonadota bacterium]